MVALKYVGRAPNNDAAMLSKSHVDAQHDTLSADPSAIASAVAAYATTNNLKDQTYVDNQDATKAKKAVVDAADATYLPDTDRGKPGGVATLTNSLYVPSNQLPALVQENLAGYVDATNILLTSEQTVSSTTTKTFLAATLDITDPGFSYQVLAMAYVAGYCPAAVDGSRRVGGGSRGKMAVLNQSDVLFSGGVTTGRRGNTLYPVLPTAPISTTPSSLVGNQTLSLWLALSIGTSFVFAPNDLRFFAFIIGAG